MSEPVMVAVGVVTCVAVVTAVVVVLAVVRAHRRARPRVGSAPVDPFRNTDADALRGDPRALKPGDLADIRGRTYSVRGSLHFTEGSWTWAEHLLDDAGGHRLWLSVEEDPDLELVLWTGVPTATVLPGPPTVEFDGRRYTRDESGQARFAGTGATGLDPAGVVEYHDYEAPDGPLLSFERYGDSPRWEVGRGERLHRAELQIFPQAG